MPASTPIASTGPFLATANRSVRDNRKEALGFFTSHFDHLVLEQQLSRDVLVRSRRSRPVLSGQVFRLIHDEEQVGEFYQAVLITLPFDANERVSLAPRVEFDS